MVQPNFDEIIQQLRMQGNPEVNASELQQPSFAKPKDVEQQDYFNKIIGQAYNNYTKNQGANDSIIQALTERLNPTTKDVARSSLSYAAQPVTGKAGLTPEQFAQQDVSAMLEPYSKMAQLQRTLREKEPETSAAIREYNFLQNLPKEERAKFLEIKRGQLVNLGSGYKNVATGEFYPKELAPGELPATRGEQARASAVGKIVGETQGAEQKKYMQAEEAERLIAEAEKLLLKATSGGFATTRRDVAAYFGYPTESSKADAQLDVLAETLTMTKPRMEGPQSDKDTISYHKAAGDLGNTKLPIEARMAALKTLRFLNDKYRDKSKEPVKPFTNIPPPPDGISLGGNAPSEFVDYSKMSDEELLGNL